MDTEIIAYGLTILLKPVLICAILAFGLSLVEFTRKGATWQISIRSMRYLFLMGLPIALVGFVAGYMTGMSRVGAVGSLIAAVLALVGGLNIFYLTSPKNNVITGFGVCLLVVTLLFGMLYGNVQREYGREARLQNLSNQEFRIRTYRKGLELPQEVPDWMTSGEPN